MGKKTVLVLGHKPDLIGFCREILVARGFSAIVARSHAGAMTAVVNHRPDAIVAVNFLHYRTLLSTLLVSIATTPGAPRPPLVVWTAMPPGGEEDMARLLPGYLPGRDCVLEKPCRPEDLVRTLSGLTRA